MNCSLSRNPRKLATWHWEYSLRVFANAQLAGIVSNVTAEKQWFLCRDARVIGRVSRDGDSFEWEIFAHDGNMRPKGEPIAFGSGSLPFCVRRLLTEMTSLYIESVTGSIACAPPPRSGERPSRKQEVAS